ncbi:mediator of RNA polymerase II transcription subunit 6-like isoform X2 [Watersipora subatra]|uniref:mediator of RNA polymerase II transcription subunit 6-like isoform X2 n=1 Tax=Watersipora subatra TaxID=2589382 RepID=UPI00355B8DA1
MAHTFDEELSISWHDSASIPLLNVTNILDYFSRSRFYDRTCNNEIVKMQRQSPDQLLNMTGIEYKLVYSQPPILYIIRKQERQSVESVTPKAHFYIIAGIVYKAPDLKTLVNSRMLNTSYNLNAALNEATKHARYHPSKGYWWDFHEQKSKEDVEPPKEQASWFQRQRVDLLLGELVRQYPMKVALPAAPQPGQEAKPASDPLESKPGIKREIGESSTEGQPIAKLARIKTEKTSH